MSIERECADEPLRLGPSSRDEILTDEAVASS